MAPDASVCTCDDEVYHCPIHVGCDQNCKALVDPTGDDAEVMLAWLHWSNHSYLAGCSHGN